MHVEVTCKMTNMAKYLMVPLLCKLLSMRTFQRIIMRQKKKKYLRSLGLGYESIHAYKHKYALFWKENADLKTCLVCDTNRSNAKNNTWKKNLESGVAFFFNH